MILLLLACATESGAPVVASTPTPDPFIALSAPLLLRRLSLDLRGVLPTVEELDDVEADPARVDAYAAAWLDDHRLEERLVERLNEHWLTVIEGFFLHHEDYGPEEPDEYRFDRSVGEEPVRFLARVAVSDLPWTESVTADWTMANSMLEGIWPLERVGGSEEWQEAHYRDGRPAGGVLMTNGLWWRYYSNATNFNRSRAAATASLLLCEDLSSRPVQISPSTESVDEGLESAIQSNPSCLACHATLDPLAMAFFGFWYIDQFDPTDQSTYHPAREGLGSLYLDTQMAWFGIPFDSPAELGSLVAADPRFVDCTVQTAARSFWQRDLDPAADFGILQDLEAEFAAGDLRYKALLEALIASSEYRAGEGPEGAMTRRLLSVGQLEASLADLTGFTWTEAGVDLLHDDVTGYRIPAGGIDADTVTRPARDHGLSRELVLRELTAIAGAYGAHHDLVEAPEEARLLQVDLADRPGDPAFETQLEALHWRLQALHPDPDLLELDASFWSQVEATEGAEAAWGALLSGMMRDPAFWSD